MQKITKIDSCFVFFSRSTFYIWYFKFVSLGPFIQGKIGRVLSKEQTFRINGTFGLK